MIINMDCIAGMRLCLADNTVDAIVCDPPYELGFMGKAWDATGIANSVEMWREALRVLKPGGHLLAFSGSRTYHRMACAIEDAGFDIRDQIMWVYSSGFPKSHNLDNHRGKLVCGCSTGALPYAHENTEQKPEYGVSNLRGTDVSPTVANGERGGALLQPGMSQQGAPMYGAEPGEGPRGASESRVEGRRDAVQAQGELQGHPVHPGVGVAASDGTQGRVHHAAPGRDGGMVRLPASPNGGSAPRRPRPDEQPAQQPGAVADEQRAQAVGAWPVCAGCGLPMVPEGLGTALKPAHEPICVARKPLSGTVAANVLAHGVGALNIGGCRVDAPDAPETPRFAPNAGSRHVGILNGGEVSAPEGRTTSASSAGRWPANLIHDGSDEVLAAFPDAAGQQGALTGDEPSASPGAVDQNCYGQFDRRAASIPRREADRSAARFFYCAKASRAERNIGCDDLDKRPLNWSSGTQNPGSFQSEGTDKTSQNNHPTVKPLALMQYLVRLVTPPGGLVLDPFTGSGSTWAACNREGMRFVGFELDQHYCEIAKRRAGAA